MKVEFLSAGGALSGAELVVQIPEDDLDKKALYTLQHDMPDFLVPFRHRGVDGQVELTYQLGSRGKLKFFRGQRTPEEYIRFWERALQPILDCPDWFLDPFSMVFDANYLFQDKDGAICYLYVPSHRACSSEEDLKGMVSQLARDNGVSDPELENVVLRMLVRGFQPKTFLEALRSACGPARTPEGKGTPNPLYPPPAPPKAPSKAPPEAPPKAAGPDQPTQDRAEPKPGSAPAMERSPGPRAPAGEIHIDLGGGGAERREKGEKKKGFGLFGGKEKPPKEKKEKKREKKGKTPGGKEIPLQAPTPAGPGKAEPKGGVPEPIYDPPYAGRPLEPLGSETEMEVQSPCLRLVGMTGLPVTIPVELEVGGAFTIGRYDVTVGRRQSSFEFDARTKAVSRHHAAIERDVDGYTITDLASKAGTFVDGTALKPNLPYRLRRNAKIAFGTGGADYIWEE